MRLRSTCKIVINQSRLVILQNIGSMFPLVKTIGNGMKNADSKPELSQMMKPR